MDTRRFGIEIEFVLRDDDDPYRDPDACDCEECRATSGRMDPEGIAQALTDAGVPCTFEGYTHEVMDAWKLVEDSSVDDGWELVSPPLAWNDREQVHAACETLRMLGADVEDCCGLHVHHEVSDLPLDAFKRLYRNWYAWQSHTDALTAPDRRDGIYCEHLRESDIEQIGRAETLAELSERCRNVGRYRSLNVLCFPTYGTVEVRQHEGCLDASRILAWVAYGRGIIAASVEANVGRGVSFETLLDALPLERRERQNLRATAELVSLG